MRAQGVTTWFVAACIGAGALLFFRPSSPWRMTLAVSCFALITIEFLLQQIRSIPRFPITVPIWTEKYFAGAIAAMSASFTFLSKSTTALGKYVAWFFVLASLYQLATTLFFVTAASFLLADLQREFHNQRFPQNRLPYGMVFLGAGANRFLRQVLFKVAWSLWRSSRHNDPTTITNRAIHDLRSLMEESFAHEREKKRKVVLPFSALSVLFARLTKFFMAESFGERILMIFLTPADLRRYEHKFQEYVITNSTFCIGIVSPTQAARLYGLGHDSEETTQELIGRLPRRLGEFLSLRLIQAEKDLQSLVGRLHFCLGPSILLVPETLRYAESGVEKMRGYDTVATLSVASVAPAVAVIASRAASCGLPMRRLDLALADGHRKVIPQLAEYGLAPLADAYLRFRLSDSNVERLFSLFDCVEVLMKYSVFVLMQRDPKLRTLDDLKDEHRQPTLGAWKRWLLALAAREQSTVLGQEVQKAWSTELCSSAKVLAVRVRESGIQFESEVEQNSLKGGPQAVVGKKDWRDWLQWLVDFRNVTKGHGGVDELAAGSSLEQFHAAFLDLVSLLRSLTLDAHLVRICDDGTEIKLSGWLRGTRRSSLLLRPVHKALTVEVELHSDSEEYSLQRRVSVAGNKILTWHSEKSKEDTYIDYLTGWVGTLGG